PAIVAAMRAIDRTTCHRGGLIAVMRRNMRSGVKKGISDRTTDSGLSGDESTLEKKATLRMSAIMTGKTSLWASCVVFTTAPTDASIDGNREERRRKKRTTATGRKGLGPGSARNAVAAPARVAVIAARQAAHTRNWVRPAAPTPRIFPAKSWEADSEDTTTSTTRLAFSSMTPFIIAVSHMASVV